MTQQTFKDISWGKNPKETIRVWLQLFRAQTAPLTIIIVMTAYLHGGQFNLLSIIGLVAILLAVHCFSYGHNSLMDTVMGYDRVDPTKNHHPLVRGQISIQSGHQIIHCALIVITIITMVITILFAENIILGLVSIIVWTILGQAYNDGMSKESLLASPIISVMTCAMVAWGWFLSHETLGVVGTLYLIYIFLLIMFQISWDGSLKDIRMPEKSNILVRLGVKIEKKQATIHQTDIRGYTSRMVNDLIIPTKAKRYALTLKLSSIAIIIIIMWVQINNTFEHSIALIWVVTISLLGALFWTDLIKDQLESNV